MIQEREEKLIRFIANTPQKEDRTKLLEEIAYLYTILELNTNRSNQLSVTKKAQKKEKLSYDNLKNQSRVFSDEISYIVQKVKVMEKEK